MTVRSKRRGHDGPKCGGKRKHGGGKCTQTAGWGTDHPGVGRCKLHGGSTRTHAASAKQQLVEQEARRAFGRLTDVSTPVENPLLELAKLAGDVVAWKNFMAGRIEKLETLRFEDANGGEQISGEIQLFRQALMDCNVVLATMGRLKIDERLVQIEREKVDLVARALSETLSELGLSDEQQREARGGFVRRLRLVPG